MNSEDRSSGDSGTHSWIDKISRIFQTAPKTRKDINEILEQAREDHILDTDELSIIEGAMEVTDIQVRDVMVSRSQMVVIHADEKPEEFLPAMIESGHSRFPVVGENLDDILGLVHAKDLLQIILQDDDTEFDISRFLRPVTQVPESKRLYRLLRDFRATRNHMAIVLDEYGSVSGLITIEDVLEEIVGDIEDEFDVDEDANIRKISNREYLVRAHTTIEDFNKTFNTEFDDSDYDTIAGLITQQIGHVAQTNEVVSIDRFEFKVVNADSRRLHLLRLSVTDPT